MGNEVNLPCAKRKEYNLVRYLSDTWAFFFNSVRDL